MKHLTKEELALLYYGETGNRSRDHLDTCEGCRRAYQELAAVLDRVELPPVPQRGQEYGAQVWRKLRPRLEAPARPWLSWLPAQRRWAVAAALASLLAAAFLAGRFSRPAPPQQAIAPQVRERILLVAVGDHLERSKIVLLELVNTRGNGGVDISSEQQRARDLVASNRLYRQTASRAGEAAVAGVLDELERVLLEIAHSPARLSSDEFESLRRRIEDQGILFKVRIIDSTVREKAAGSSL